MPTYQYACTEPDCGNRFDLVQSFTDPSVSECPVCNGAVRKVYGSVGVVFKGSGFYRTDSRVGAKDSGSESKESAKKSDSKSDSSSSSAKSDATSSSSSTTSSSSTSASASSGKAAASA